MMVQHVLDVGAVNRMLRSPVGGVSRDLLRRGYRVEAEAKRRVRADTGRLRTSIHARPITGGTVMGVEIGTNAKYAMYVHDGTGIYGPHGTPITSTRGGVLRFRVKGQTGYVFARSVVGQRPNPFLRDALKFMRL